MRTRISHNALLACGVLAALTYVVTDVVASLRYPDYNFIDQAVSELFAIGAPTSVIVVPLFTVSSTLVAAFALAVWTSSRSGRVLRWLAAMMFANAVNSFLLWNFFPMHMRGAALTSTDLMHAILAVNPFVLLSVVFGIVAFTGSFRVYSVATVLLYWFPIRRWMNRWGATRSDLARVMACDSLLPNYTYSGTTAVAVNARPEHIWPWLMHADRLSARRPLTATTGSIASSAILIVRAPREFSPNFNISPSVTRFRSDAGRR